MSTLKSIIFPTIILILIGCSNKFTIQTNLDRTNFTEYFSLSNVKIYTSETEFETSYQYIGLVEGEDCQKKSHHAKPDEDIARTKARKSANNLNANAVVFSQCALIENNTSSKQCIATTICYGKAYYINHSSGYD